MLVKIGKYIEFYVYHRSYLLWCPVVTRLRVFSRPENIEQPLYCIPGICISMFVKFSHFFPIFLFVRALFAKTVSTRTHEARPDTLVEVSARSVHSGPSKFPPPPAGVDKTISLVSVRGPYFVRTYRSDNVVSFPLMSCERTAVVIRTYDRHTI